MPSVRCIVVILALVAAPPCWSRFRLPEIEQVPVERLIGNLETELARLTESRADSDRILDMRRRLARAHALAYARGAATLDVRQGTNDVFELRVSGFLQSLGDRGQRTDDAAEHLASAIELYDMILQVDRYDIRSRLGLAWVLEQSGRTQEALAHYRLVTAAAWPIELGYLNCAELLLCDDDRVFGSALYAGEMTMFQEAAAAVLRYLDPEDDAAEIAELESHLAVFDEVGRFVTPILVPLDAGDDFDALVDPGAAVAFDLDGSGLSRRWGWVTPRAAWLVWDPERSGQIDNGLQLFGSVSFFVFWDNGYEALAMLDDDRDGRLSGAELAGLALWTDADGDGISDPGEVVSVAAHGIASIATAAQQHQRGFPFNPAGIEMANGSVRATYDWIVESPAITVSQVSF